MDAHLLLLSLSCFFLWASTSCELRVAPAGWVQDFDRPYVLLFLFFCLWMGGPKVSTRLRPHTTCHTQFHSWTAVSSFLFFLFCDMRSREWNCTLRVSVTLCVWTCGAGVHEMHRFAFPPHRSKFFPFSLSHRLGAVIKDQ